MWIIYIILIISIIIFYYYYTKDIFHPALIFLGVWYLTCAISCVDFDDFMAPWCQEMYFVTIISGIAFFGGTLFFIRKTTVRPVISKITIPYTYTFIVRSLFVICLSCYIIEWINGGAVISMVVPNDAIGDVKHLASQGDIAGIHYGTLFLPYIAILVFFRLLNTSDKSIIDIIIVITILSISSIFKISRGDMMIYIFSFLFLYSRYYKVTLKYLIFSGIILLSVLIGFMFIRVDQTSIVMTTTNNPFISIIYSYFATCFANLNDFIIANHPYHLGGNATLAPIWTLAGLKGDIDVIKTEQLGLFNACTYLYGFYHDYKLIGIIFFPFILGITLSMAYYNSIYGRQLWILLPATMQKAIFVAFFGNYFTGEFVIFFPYLLTTFIIVFVLSYKIKPLSLKYYLRNK